MMDLDFTLANLQALVKGTSVREITAVKGNRSSCKHPNWAFTNNPIAAKESRAFMKGKPFRTLLDMAQTAFTNLQSSFAQYARFQDILFWRFFQQVLAFPFPKPEWNRGIMSDTAKNSNRVVYCTEVINQETKVPTETSDVWRVAKIRQTQHPEIKPLPPRYSNIQIDSENCKGAANSYGSGLSTLFAFSFIVFLECIKHMSLFNLTYLHKC